MASLKSFSQSPCIFDVRILLQPSASSFEGPDPPFVSRATLRTSASSISPKKIGFISFHPWSTLLSSASFASGCLRSSLRSWMVYSFRGSIPPRMLFVIVSIAPLTSSLLIFSLNNFDVVLISFCQTVLGVWTG